MVVYCLVVSDPVRVAVRGVLVVVTRCFQVLIHVDLRIFNDWCIL